MTTPPPVTRAHREAALLVARDALGCISSDDRLPDRIDEWLAGTPGAPIDVSAMVWLGTLSEALAAVEHRGRTEAEEGGKGWVALPELPDSDVRVLAISRDGDHALVQLEFTDDSEGHGEPYWDTEVGPVPLSRFTHWMPLPPPPPGDR